ncbi:hypothetical protein RDABS01_007373 [Bienertia sinuspersici]
MSMNLKDYAMFSCVCRSWHEAATVVKSNDLVLQQQMPWLVLSNDDGDKRNLFDLSNNKCYNLSLPETCNRNCYGMVLIHLFNPLTRALLPLPSYLTFLHQPGESSSDEDDIDEDEDEDVIDEDEDEDDLQNNNNNNPRFIRPESPYDENEWFRRYYIRRAYVLQQSFKLVVVVIYGEGEFVAAATPEDTMWTPIIDATDVRDVVYCHTLGLTLFVQGSGFVSYCDLHQLPTNKSPLRTYDEDTVETDGFQLYKLDLQTKEWEEVLDLGDVVLFIGNSPATSVKASSFPSSCNPNSIYFNDDGREGCYWGPKYNEVGKMIDFVQGGRDMGACDFANLTVEPFIMGMTTSLIIPFLYG